MKNKQFIISINKTSDEETDKELNDMSYVKFDNEAGTILNGKPYYKNTNETSDENLVILLSSKSDESYENLHGLS